MDGFSLIIGGALGVLVGWAFSSATSKQREASYKLSKASQAKEEMTKMEGEIKNNRGDSHADVVQGFLLYALGFIVIFIMGAILFSSLG